MNVKKLSMICIAALIPTVFAIITDYFLLYCDLRLTGEIIENHDRSLFPISLAMCILCGLVFIVTEVLTVAIFSKKRILEKRSVCFAMLPGALIYALIMAFVFPKSLDMLYIYLPKSEMSAVLSLLFFQISAYTAAALSIIVCGELLYNTGKSEQ